MITINIFTDSLLIFVSTLNFKVKCDIIDSCNIRNCTTKTANGDVITVTGNKSDLYDLLHELTYAYPINLG